MKVTGSFVTDSRFLGSKNRVDKVIDCTSFFARRTETHFDDVPYPRRPKLQGV